MGKYVVQLNHILNQIFKKAVTVQMSRGTKQTFTTQEPVLSDVFHEDKFKGGSRSTSVVQFGFNSV